MAAKILVVDDELQVTELLSGFLKEQGYEVLAANDGYSVVPTFSRFLPDLLILDFRMPAGDGSQVLAKIRGLSAGASVPVIFLSAEAPETLRFAIRESPTVRILAKPPSLQQVAELVKLLLGPKAAKPPQPPQEAPPPAPLPPRPFDGDEPPPSSGVVLDLDS